MLCVFTCSRALRAFVITCLACKRAYVLSALAYLRAYVLGVLACVRGCYDEMFYFLTCSHLVFGVLFVLFALHFNI